MRPCQPRALDFLEGKTKLGTCVLLVAFVGVWEMIRNPFLGKMLNDLQWISVSKKQPTPGLDRNPKDLCDAEKKKMLDEFMALDGSKRDTMIKVQKCDQANPCGIWIPENLC